MNTSGEIPTDIIDPETVARGQIENNKPGNSLAANFDPSQFTDPKKRELYIADYAYFAALKENQFPFKIDPNKINPNTLNEVLARARKIEIALKTIDRLYWNKQGEIKT